MPENAQRDVGLVPELFLSYSSADHEAVFRIQRLLEKKQISTFMDRKDLEAGMPWVHALEEALRRVRGVAIFLGPAGLGPWQRRELWWALDRQARAEAAGQRFPVIPVLLPETKLDSVPSFLMLNMWVDLRRGLEDEGALDALARALDGGASTAPAPPAVPAGLCPYRGLHAFREEDSPLFFGREEFARTLFQKVEVDRLKLVLGVLAERPFRSDADYSEARASVIVVLAGAGHTEAALKQFPMEKWEEMHGDDRCRAATAIAVGHAKAGRLRLARLAVSRFCPSDENMLEAYTTLLVEHLNRRKAGGGETPASPATE